MALCKLGPLVSAISGELGTVVFHGGGRSQVISKSPCRPRPQSLLAQLAAQDLAYYTAYWNQLTADQQTSWLNYATAHPETNSLGVTRTPSGFNAFTSHNLAYANRPRTGPIVFSTPPPGKVDTPYIASAAISISGAKTITTTASPAFAALAHVTLRRFCQYGQRNGAGSRVNIGFTSQTTDTVSIAAKCADNDVEFLEDEEVNIAMYWTYYVFSPLFSFTPPSQPAYANVVVTA